MARGRFVSNKISMSERVAKLSPTAQLLFTWMIIHLDCEGRMSGNPKIIKQMVIPHIRVTYKQVDKWLNEMHNLKKNGHGLITRYEVEGNQYIYMHGFDSEQIGLHKDREAASNIPAPPDYVPEIIQRYPRAIESLDDIIDLNLKNVVREYEDNIGIATAGIYERLKIIADDYPEGWFKDAVNEALGQNVRNLKYIETILESWAVNGKNTRKGTSNGTHKQKPASSEQRRRSSTKALR